MVPPEMKELSKEEVRDLNISFPFRITLEHAKIDLADMFKVTAAFDLYEMAADRSDNEGLVKENMLIDVLEVTPTTTTMKVTLSQPMPYEMVAKHIDIMVKQVGKQVYKGKVSAAKIIWDIDKTGVSSDMRGVLRSVI